MPLADLLQDERTYGSRITGIAAYRPARQLTNEDLAPLTTVSPEWIEQRTGIKTRHHAGEGEGLVAMSVAAGEKALVHADVDPAEVDLTIVATATRKRRMPGIAPEVASRIGLPNSGAYDLNAVCAGFTYSLAMASNAVRLGEARTVLVVGAERTSDWIDPQDPDTFVIFGDGAGAAVVSRSTEVGVGPAVWGSDGARHKVLGITEKADGREYVQMNGPLVYKWSTATMPDVAHRACAAAGITIDDVDWFVPHQANNRIIRTLTHELGLPPERVVNDVVVTGNTSAASVPLALSSLYDSGRSTPGDIVLLLGFGAGLTYAGQIVRMP
ncbi:MULTISPECIES: beta-ketoacyl-ACP synthase III [unclassified Streptomyces]|uniref:beta-ketoacyl-ACP synthase III n=1 Tax=unclassified Streptomyces TaxID=2593676 RepID=UPI0011106B95|nr:MULTISPECIES: beta-ketoacyl-ACP synthase III [unclassified Streptomyces]MCI3929128.1 ketoacyl-ACP synthase III [Streptomyces sp. AN091965]QCX75030.1 3-oxoacyl-[acyl-carrier-protein] synthase 3 [Streptomyces sp. YIM 121038]